MTEVAQTYLGNIDRNPDLAELIAIETYLEVHLSYSDRTKGRIHAHTDRGIAVGIIKNRDRLLQSGDLFKTNSQKLLLIRLQKEKLLILDFSGIENNIAPSQLVYLGHVLGNNHYPISIRDRQICVQIATDPKIVEKTISNLNISGLQMRYE